MNLAHIVADIAARIEAEADEIERMADAKTPGLEPGPFGMAIALTDGSLIQAGAAHDTFPIQIIS